MFYMLANIHYQIITAEVLPLPDRFWYYWTSRTGSRTRWRRSNSMDGLPDGARLFGTTEAIVQRERSGRGEGIDDYIERTRHISPSLVYCLSSSSSPPSCTQISYF
jgi:hypothetical protein